MKVGDLVLVRYRNREEHLGIVVVLADGELKVAWDDGDISWILKRKVEVLDESR
tara:strand:- start:507 stop:668 length:162 start_codon:yes stop_codon:yes gene_type:complete